MSLLKVVKALSMIQQQIYFLTAKHLHCLKQKKVKTTYNHGAGCTFAAAITANLANGLDVKEAVTEAKKFVSAAIANGWKLNEYVGPVYHGAKNKFGAPDDYDNRSIMI